MNLREIHHCIYHYTQFYEPVDFSAFETSTLDSLILHVHFRGKIQTVESEIQQTL